MYRIQEKRLIYLSFGVAFIMLLSIISKVFR